MQLGFHAGHLIAALISLALLAAFIPMPVHMWSNSYFSFKEAYTWRMVSFIGGLFGIVWTVLGRIYLEKNESKRKQKSESPLKSLLNSGEYRQTLFSFWLILTGLLYMYYSVITILPEMLVRNDFLIPFYLPLSNENYPFVTILILVSTLGAHLWLGFFCHSAWNMSERWEKSQQISGIFGFFIRQLIKLRKGYFYFIRKLANSIGIQYSKLELNEIVIYKNIDLMLIVFIGFTLIVLGILGAVLFPLLFEPKPSLGSSKLILFYMLVPVIMVANSGWALIPSSLSSRFPEQFRATASNLAYNGGLVIGFASPFIMLENFLTFKSEWIIFVPMILGALAMVIGATRLINMKNRLSQKSQ